MDNIPDFFPEEVKRVLRLLSRQATDNDVSDWVQVGTLDGQDILRRKQHNRRADALQRQIDTLKARQKEIVAKTEVLAAVWWDSLHVKYSLPRANYHITDDNRIMMEPTRKP